MGYSMAVSPFLVWTSLSISWASLAVKFRFWQLGRTEAVNSAISLPPLVNGMVLNLMLLPAVMKVSVRVLIVTENDALLLRPADSVLGLLRCVFALAKVLLVRPRLRGLTSFAIRSRLLGLPTLPFS